MDKKCPDCGIWNTSNANHCKNCGKDISDLEPESKELDKESIKETRHSDDKFRTSQSDLKKRTSLKHQEKELSETQVLSNPRKDYFPAIAIVSSIIIAIIIQYWLSPLFPDGHIFRRLFFPEEIFLRIVPFLIIVIFFWSIFDLLIIKRRETRIQRKNLMSLSLREIPSLVSKLEFDTIENCLKKISGSGWVPSRLFFMLNQMRKFLTPVDLRDSFKYQSELNTDKAIGSYSTARFFIGAMPILGFIGTVLGISIAVGGFSKLLKTDIEKIDPLKEGLSNVSEGLAFAFDTTLLGLFGSLIVMLIITWIQKAEEDLMTEFEEFGLKIIDNYNQVFTGHASPLDSRFSSSATNQREFDKMIGEVQTELKQNLVFLKKGILEIKQRLIGDIKEFSSTFLEASIAIREQQPRIADGYTALINTLTLSLNNSQLIFNQKTEEMMNILNSVERNAQKSADQFDKSVTSFIEALSHFAKAMEALSVRTKKAEIEAGAIVQETELVKEIKQVIHKTNTILNHLTEKGIPIQFIQPTIVNSGISDASGGNTNP
ncbi:MAG: MotA/TolQ/ExbB proton channel family protein [Saprospiraceae bacterium]